MWAFFKLKLWEVLLVVSVCLLAAQVYETHNAPGRYVSLFGRGISDHLLDTATGKAWGYDKEKGEWYVIQPPIPNRSHSLGDNN